MFKKVLLFLCLQVAVFANSIRIDFGPFHYGNGGEFVVKPSTIPADVAASTAFVNSVAANYVPGSKGNGGFYTFCLEYNELFTLGQNYNFQVSTTASAVHGGEVVSDPISVGTAYLYSAFAKGTIPGYHYFSSTTPWAKDMQNTIWFLENERFGVGGSFIPNPGIFDSFLIAEFGSVANAKQSFANSANYGWVTPDDFGVSVLNLGNPPEFRAQDQLVFLGDRLDVPDSGSNLSLAGVGLVFLVGFGFKKK